MKKSYLLVMFLMVSFTSMSAEISYRLKVGERWEDPGSFAARAAEYLKAKDEGFDDSLECTVWVDPASKDKFIQVTFFHSLGQRGWRVFFARDGKIVKHWSGVLKDEFGPRPK